MKNKKFKTIINKIIICHHLLNIKKELVIIKNIIPINNILNDNTLESQHILFLKKWDRSILSCDRNPFGSILRLPIKTIFQILFTTSFRNKMAKIYINKLRPTNKLTYLSDNTNIIYDKYNCGSFTCCQFISYYIDYQKDTLENNFVNSFSLINTLNPYQNLLNFISKYCGILVKNLSQGIDTNLIKNINNKDIDNVEMNDINEISNNEISNNKQLQRLWNYGIPPIRTIRRCIIYQSIYNVLNEKFKITNLDNYINNYTYDRLKKDIIKISYQIIPILHIEDFAKPLKRWVISKYKYKPSNMMWDINKIFKTIHQQLYNIIIPNLNHKLSNSEKDSYLEMLTNLCLKQILNILIFITTYESIFFITAVLI